MGPTQRHMPRPNREPRLGSATVEMALVLPIVIFMLFSTLEMGVILKHRAELSSVARAAARLGAVSATTSRMNQEIDQTLDSIHPDRVTRQYYRRAWDAGSATWGNWSSLGTDGSQNDAASGDQIGVLLTAGHQLIFPGLMGPVFGSDESGEIELEARSVMMRE